MCSVRGMGRKFINEKKVLPNLPSCPKKHGQAFQIVSIGSLTLVLLYLFCDTVHSHSWDSTFKATSLTDTKTKPSALFLPTANLRRDFCKELETALYVTLSKQKFFTVTVSGYVPRLASERCKFHPSKYVPLCGGFGAEIRGTPSRPSCTTLDIFHSSEFFLGSFREISMSIAVQS